MKRDTTAPSVLVTGVTNGGVYTQGSVPAAGCATMDELLGVAREASLSVTGGDASGLGTFTASCTGAADNADNPECASVSYQMVPVAGSYDFEGFFPPVDNPPTFDQMKEMLMG